MYESYPYEFYCSCCSLCESAADVAKYNLAHRFATDKDLGMHIPSYTLIESPPFNY